MSSVLSHHFRFLAQHHRQCTVRILDHLRHSSKSECAAALFEKSDCLFFGSIGGTLNHLYGAEVLWFSRLTGKNADQAAQIASLYALEGAELQEAWQSLLTTPSEIERHLLSQCDRWCTLLSEKNAEGCSDEWILASARYQDTEGNDCSVTRAAGLSQVFQHGAHHRGQVTAALFQQQQQQLQEETTSLPGMDMQNMGDAFLKYEIIPSPPGSSNLSV